MHKNKVFLLISYNYKKIKGHTFCFFIGKKPNKTLVFLPNEVKPTMTKVLDAWMKQRVEDLLRLDDTITTPLLQEKREKCWKENVDKCFQGLTKCLLGSLLFRNYI